MAPSSSSSALIGTMPANEHDRLVVTGFYRLTARTFGPLPKDSKPFPPLIPNEVPEPRPHDSLQWQMYGQVCSVLAVIVLVTGTRLLLRGCKKELRWGADDWAIIVGAVFALAFCGTRIAVTRDGAAGKHMYDATYAELDYLFATQAGVGYVFYVLAIGFTKISICLFNRRLTGLVSRRWMYYHYTLLAMITIFMLIFALGQPLACRPLWSNYRISDLGARDYKTVCLDGYAMNATFSYTHLILDMFILPVPLIIMKRLKLTRWQQARLIFLFGIGLVSILGSAMTVKVMYSKQADLFYNYPRFNRWMMIDLVFAIAVASLPTLNALLPRSWRKGASIVREEERAGYRSGSSSAGQRTTMHASRSCASRVATTEYGSAASSQIHIQTSIEVEEKRGVGEKRGGDGWASGKSQWGESSSSGSSSSSTMGERERAAWETKVAGGMVREVEVEVEPSPAGSEQGGGSVHERDEKGRRV